MDMKKIAKRGLIILFATVFVCLFFGRTVQTLSTPKVRLTYPTNARMVTETKMDAKLFFTEEEGQFVKLAEKYPITINAVYFGVGNKVAKGDVIFDATLNDYEKKKKDINAEILKKTEELIELDSKNSKYPQNSERNKLYKEYIAASQELIKARANEMSRARLAGGEPDKSKWSSEQEKYDKAERMYKQMTRLTSSTLGDESFEYIKKRDAVLAEIEEKEKDAAELDHAKVLLSEIKAEKEGVITFLEIKGGDEYNGNKALYKLSPASNPPVLRTIINELQEMPEKGDKGKVKNNWGSSAIEVVAVGKNKEGQRFADFGINDEIINASGGLKALMGEEKIQLIMTKRANRPSTIIPASALRQEGDKNFVYVSEYKDGGIMSGYTVCKRMDVTVLSKNDESVSIAEDFYEQVIDREDRPIKDKARILENK